ncbi:MAG: MFS transporter [Chloroflexi bacterium]|nr:MFS transporter [Chloroflexota bacterium]
MRQNRRKETSDLTESLPQPGPGSRFRVRAFDSLAIRDYRFLWLGQLSTSMGQWMDQVARGWLMYQLTHSAIDLGIVMALRGLPTLFFGVIAGVAADRYGRKAQLIISQVVNLFLNLVLAILVTTHHVLPWHIYLTGFLSGTVQAFQQPARQSLISDLVGRKYLMNAIGLNSAAANLARSVGPAVAGIIISLIGVDGSYYLQAVVYALATVWTVQMRVPKHLEDARHAANRGISFMASLGEGLSYLAFNRIILALVLLGLVPLTLGMPFTSLLPIFAEDVLHAGVTGQGLILTCVGIGALVGAVTVASQVVRTEGSILLASSALFGVSLVFFSRSPWLAAAGAFGFMAGLFNTSYRAQAQTALQILAPDKLRGRIMSIYLLDRGLVPIGSLLAGVLAHYLGAPDAVTILGAAVALITMAIAITVPSLRKLSLR